MTRMTDNSVFDAALGIIKTGTTAMWVLASTSAVASDFDSAKANKLASATVASTIFTIGDGDVSGRQVAVAIVSGISVTTTGSAKNLGLINTATSTMLHMTQTSTQVLTAGNLVNTSQFDIEFEDPSAP